MHSRCHYTLCSACMQRLRSRCIALTPLLLNADYLSLSSFILKLSRSFNLDNKDLRAGDVRICGCLSCGRWKHQEWATTRALYEVQNIDNSVDSVVYLFHSGRTGERNVAFTNYIFIMLHSWFCTSSYNTWISSTLYSAIYCYPFLLISALNYESFSFVSVVTSIYLLIQQLLYRPHPVILSMEMIRDETRRKFLKKGGKGVNFIIIESWN